MSEKPDKNKRYLTVSSAVDMQRLDNYLFRHWKTVPKSLIYRLIRQGRIRCNGKRVKVSDKITAGDVIAYPTHLTMAPSPTALAAQSIPSSTSASVLRQCPILYEDAYLLAINKPAGLAVHAGSGVVYGVIESLRRELACPQLELVHRIDKATSGCLLLAKRLSAQRTLQSVWGSAAVCKHYCLLVHGQWPTRLSTINLPLSRFQYTGGERLVVVDHRTGKPAVTRFRVLETLSRWPLTWLEAELETGRTHQIRVHAQSAGCPLVGDERYGQRDWDQALDPRPKRLYLHARHLSFPHPVSGTVIQVSAPLDAAWGVYGISGTV